MVEKVLQQLGLNNKEIQVYLTILKQGKILPVDIAAITGINRTTVYATAKQLIQKGMIRQEDGKRTYLLIRAPEDMDLMLQREQEKLNQKQHLLKTAVEVLRPLMKNERYEVPRLEFKDEEQLEQHMYQQSVRWSESIMATDGIWHGYQDHSFVEHYEGWIDWYWKQQFSKEVVLQCFTNDSAIETKMAKKRYNRRQMKWWGEGEISSTLWINGEHVVVIVTRTRPHYLFEIHDKLLALNLREVFGRLWNDVR